MIFVSHNLGLILETCDRITVMYSGEAVETGSIRDVFDRMRHPYTQGFSARSRCRAPTRIRGRWWLSPASFLCRTSGRKGAISDRVAITSLTVSATPPKSR
jgi:ABC-type glutathione transport system ATPase component